MSGNEFTDFVRGVSQDPVGQIKGYVGQGRKVVGYMCSYVPEELLYAAGLLPVRLLGRASQISKADKHLQSYCCSHVRGFLEDFLNGDYKDLSGVLFANTCDTMQGFYDIFKLNFPDVFVQNLNFPNRLDTESAFKFASDGLKIFKDGIEKFTGAKILPDALKDAVEVYNKNRELMGKLYDIHAKNPDAFPSAVLLQATLASMFMDKRDMNPKLEEFVKVAAAAPGPAKARKKIILVGSVNTNVDVYNLLDEFGATVADDDLCTGRRYFEGLVESPTEEGVLKRYFERNNCACKHKSNTSRGDYVLKMVKDREASGVIFLLLKFCDPHAFDYPYMKNMLEKAGVRNHLVEFEMTSENSGQMRTKIQAFAETLK